MVQEHHARRLHWDFRLERDGVLVSWAVPRGVPLDPSVNHLAVHTEDHPLSYLDFEGEIPKGNYGAGKVTIWERGTYECLKWEPREVMVVLDGERVQGKYVLFHTDGDQWMIHRMGPPQDPGWEPVPEHIEPMWPVTGDLPADDTGYGFEIAWDGFRALSYVDGGQVRLADALGQNVTTKFPELGPMGRALGSRAVILDGEIVGLTGDGRPDRAPLERRLSTTKDDDSAVRRARLRDPVAYMVYDLLYLDGHRTLDVPYAERRERLAGFDLAGPHWQAPAHHVGDGKAFLEVTREQGLPGVVAKRLDSPYRPGTHSPDWTRADA